MLFFFTFQLKSRIFTTQTFLSSKKTMFDMQLIVNDFCYRLLALGTTIVAYFFFHPQWFLIINIITFFLYYSDKQSAQEVSGRIPEKVLLLFGLFGGWNGAIVAQQLFRHKNVKQPFQTQFICTIVLNTLFMPIIFFEKTEYICDFLKNLLINDEKN